MARWKDRDRLAEGFGNRFLPVSDALTALKRRGGSRVDVADALSGLVSGVLLGGILGLTALGLSIVLGVMRLVNLAHGVFLVFGAYVGLFFLAFTGLDPLLGLPLIALFVAALAIPLHRFLLAPLAERGAEAQMMTMFAVAIIMENLFVLCFSADTRSIALDYATLPLALGPVTVPLIYVIGCAISVALIGLIHALITRTAFGRDLRASAADPQAAAILGVDVGRTQRLTFALGVACAGVGGTLIGAAFQFSPSSGGDYLLNSLAVVVLGGLGNVLGTLIGGLTLGVLQSLGGLVLGDGYRDLLGMAVFLLVLAFKPTGLWGRGRGG
jgi:branched-chain amino acid transport system permease protein